MAVVETNQSGGLRRGAGDVDDPDENHLAVGDLGDRVDDLVGHRRVTSLGQQFIRSGEVLAAREAQDLRVVEVDSRRAGHDGERLERHRFALRRVAGSRRGLSGGDAGDDRQRRDNESRCRVHATFDVAGLTIGSSGSPLAALGTRDDRSSEGDERTEHDDHQPGADLGVEERDVGEVAVVGELGDGDEQAQRRGDDADDGDRQDPLRPPAW